MECIMHFVITFISFVYVLWNKPITQIEFNLFVCLFTSTVYEVYHVSQLVYILLLKQLSLWIRTVNFSRTILIKCKQWTTTTTFVVVIYTAYSFDRENLIESCETFNISLCYVLDSEQSLYQHTININLFIISNT